MKIVFIGSFVILFLLSVTGCDLFETREPEEPKGQAEWNYFPITAEQTLKNLVDAYNYNANADKYATILADDFRFYFDAQDVQDFSLPVYWDKENEVIMRSMISLNLQVTLDEIDDKEDIIQADRATFNRHYEIRKGLIESVLFSGSLTLNLRREGDGFWKIYRWEDYRKDNQDTWGRLKYEFIP